MLKIAIWAAGLAALGTVLAGPAGAAPVEPRLVDLRPATVRIANGVELTVESGRFEVPESRVWPTANRVVLPFYRLRSTAARPAAPIFLLAGGPGASWIDQLTNVENYDEVAFYRTIADVVIFDQRGGGHAEPRMTCPQTAKLPAGAPFDLRRSTARMRELAVQCRDSWLAKRIDLSAYNTVENAADVDALRAALGYDRMTLIGGSYGSHLALQIMRRYPDRVARSVIYGVEGPDDTWDDPTATLATLCRIAAAAEASAELGPLIPKRGLIATLTAVIERLDRSPVTVETGRGDTKQSVVVNGALIRFIATRSAGRRSSLNAWPEMVLAFDRGDYAIAAAAAARFGTLSIQDPVHYMMDCAAGVSPERRRRFARAPERAVLGEMNAEYIELCGVWPAADGGARYRSAVTARVPTLVLHGDWDMSTPLENARAAARALPLSQLVVVAGGTHGALYNLLEHWSPMKGRLADFLNGRPVSFPRTVAMPKPEFKARSSP